MRRRRKMMQPGDIVVALKKGKGKWALPLSTEARIECQGVWGSWRLRTQAGKVHYAKEALLCLVPVPDPGWANPTAKKEEIDAKFAVKVCAIAASGKASKVIFLKDDKKQLRWLPHSQCEGLPAIRLAVVEVSIPGWLVKKKGVDPDWSVQEAGVREPAAPSVDVFPTEKALDLMAEHEVQEQAKPISRDASIEFDILDILIN